MELLSITVLIPVYNRENEILFALRSILKQKDYLPQNVYILDDNSNDNTVAVCKNLQFDFNKKNINLLVFESDKNRGPSYQRNKGWDNADTEFIALLDSDDKWERNFLKTFKRDLKVKEISFWACNFQKSHIKKKRKNSYWVSYLSQLTSNKATCSTSIIKRDIKERFNEKMKYSEDFRLFSELTYKYGLYFNQDELVKLGRGLNSIGGLSGNIHKMRIGELRTYMALFQYNIWAIPFIPFLVVFSIGKHFRLVVLRILKCR